MLMDNQRLLYVKVESEYCFFKTTQNSMKVVIINCTCEPGTIHVIFLGNLVGKETHIYFFKYTHFDNGSNLIPRTTEGLNALYRYRQVLELMHRSDTTQFSPEENLL